MIFVLIGIGVGTVAIGVAIGVVVYRSLLDDAQNLAGSPHFVSGGCITCQLHHFEIATGRREPDSVVEAHRCLKSPP